MGPVEGYQVSITHITDITSSKECRKTAVGFQVVGSEAQIKLKSVVFCGKKLTYWSPEVHTHLFQLLGRLGILVRLSLKIKESGGQGGSSVLVLMPDLS